MENITNEDIIVEQASEALENVAEDVVEVRTVPLGTIAWVCAGGVVVGYAVASVVFDRVIPAIEAKVRERKTNKIFKNVKSKNDADNEKK